MAKNPKRPRDPNQLAKMIVDLATGETVDENPTGKKDPNAVALGRKGGIKGGRARANKLSSTQRSVIAKKAAKERWKNK